MDGLTGSCCRIPDPSLNMIEQNSELMAWVSAERHYLPRIPRWRVSKGRFARVVAAVEGSRRHPPMVIEDVEHNFLANNMVSRRLNWTIVAKYRYLHLL